MTRPTFWLEYLTFIMLAGLALFAKYGEMPS